MVKSTSNKGTKQAIRMLLVVVGIVIGLVALVVIPQVAYNHHEAYKDRPLADGYEYVGRHCQPPLLANTLSRLSEAA